jgi:TldD protein
LKEFTDRALNLAQVRGATYADIRIVQRRTQNITVKNGVVEGLSDNESQGFGVRVVVDGAWGFASSARLAPAEVDRVTALAVQIAGASALFRTGHVRLGPPVSHVGTYRTPVSRSIPGRCRWRKRRPAAPGRRGAAGHTWRESPPRAWPSGARTRPLPTARVPSWSRRSSRRAAASRPRPWIPERGEVQKRSYPNSFGRDQRQEGWEAILDMDLPGHAPRIGEEAVALLSADPCPSGVTTLILGPTQLALQVHESCGHPIELDRVFGTEASYAGTSFLTPEKYGSFRYGSDVVNMTADATIPGGLGTFGWDDEGVPAQRVPIVREGMSSAATSPPGRRSSSFGRSSATGHPRLGRGHARRWLEPDPPHPHDQRQPRAGRPGHSTTWSPIRTTASIWR